MLEQPQLEKRQTWSTIRWILGRVGRATRIRAAQAEKLRDFIRKSPHPVIICGDFNDTPNSYVYKVVSAGMRDTFRDRGFGLGTTFGGGLPLLRIDYILTDTGISVLSCETIHNRVFSDHYPVVVHLQ
jgi:endonuclease/exonuclease/phosphatase family metal-dependent hydrolase